MQNIKKYKRLCLWFNHEKNIPNKKQKLIYKFIYIGELKKSVSQFSIPVPKSYLMNKIKYKDTKKLVKDNK